MRNHHPKIPIPALPLPQTWHFQPSPPHATLSAHFGVPSMSAKPISPVQRPTRKKSKASGILKVASLGLAGLIAGLLSGCTVSTTSPALTSYSNLVGNWQFTSNSILPALSGNLTVNGSQVSGTLHPLATTSTTLGGTITSH